MKEPKLKRTISVALSLQMLLGTAAIAVVLLAAPSDAEAYCYTRRRCYYRYGRRYCRTYRRCTVRRTRRCYWRRRCYRRRYCRYRYGRRYCYWRRYCRRYRRCY